MRPRPSQGRLAAAAFVAVMGLGATSAAQVKPEAASNLSDADKARALALYEEGRTRYDLGEYDAAIAKFKAAYEISAAPLLLFNVAQSYRLKGDCTRALDGYRHFLRVDPGASVAPEAEAHVRGLITQCPTAKPTAPAGEPSPDVTAPALAASTSEPAPDRPGKRASLIFLGSGLALLAGGGALAIWNHQRFASWSDEDRRLALPPPAGDRQATEWIERQDRNDRLLRSVRRTNYATITLGVSSLACLLVAGAIPRWH